MKPTSQKRVPKVRSARRRGQPGLPFTRRNVPPQVTPPVTSTTPKLLDPKTVAQALQVLGLSEIVDPLDTFKFATEKEDIDTTLPIEMQQVKKNIQVHVATELKKHKKKIEKAFRTLSIKGHPNKGGNAAVYKSITGAYTILTSYF